MEDFNKLTMRGRARRLRALAEKALDLWDLDVQRLGLLCNETNGIFRIDTADGRKLALRIYDPSGCHGRDDITLEASWLAALGRETDLGVPVPMATRGGDLMALVEAAGVPGPRFCMMQSWIPGPDLEDRLTPVNYEKLGTFAARLHVHADGFTRPDGIKTRTLDNVFPYVDSEHEFVEPMVIFDRENTDLFSGGQDIATGSWGASRPGSTAPPRRFRDARSREHRFGSWLADAGERPPGRSHSARGG
jgi:hypothetical protein